MTEKIKKIDRQYVLSDSSVNVYGFRLLTSGYQLDAFRKNPIGYYMHRRDDGIAVKWEDLRIEDDNIVGTPVINLSNPRGQQICDEAENGFLNAASVGHIVVLEYSTDPELMLPGQTGPTITKWYNKECSLVDIPGNNNALTALYDAQENEITLLDLGTDISTIPSLAGNAALTQIRSALSLENTTPDTEIVSAIQLMLSDVSNLKAENTTLKCEKQTLQNELDSFNETRTRQTVKNLLERAIEDRKVTVSLRDRLAQDYATKPEALQELIAAMPAYRSIAENLKLRQDNTEGTWHWNDYEKNDPSGKKLKDLRANDPIRYKELFEQKFNN